MAWCQGSGTGSVKYLTQDERGSVAAISDSTTTVFSYDPYGQPGSSNTGRFQFTGQAWVPEAGLYYYKARFYNPNLGRFMTPDPAGYGAGDMNLYAYVGDDPVNAVDPTGMEVNYLSSEFVARACDGHFRGDQCVRDTDWDSLDIIHGVVDWLNAANVGPDATCLAFRGAEEFCKRYNQGSESGGRASVVAGGAAIAAGVAGGYACAAGGCQAAAATVRTAAPRVVNSAQKLCPVNCFVAGTLVATSDGPKAIEEIRVGDLVLSRDEFTGETAFRPVNGLINGRERVIWDVVVEVRGPDGRPLQDTIRATDDHPFRTTDGAWTEVKDLQAGGWVVTADGEARIVSVTQTSDIEKTYNFEVDGFHTYFVGAVGVWVHNACADAALRRLGATVTRSGSHANIAIKFAGNLALRDINIVKASLIAQGVTTAIVRSGPVINDKLNGFLSQAAAAGAAPWGAQVFSNGGNSYSLFFNFLR